MICLGIETSCDDTSIGIVEQKEKGNIKKILANITFSQHQSHRQYGGVFPEIAARKHFDNIFETIDQALKKSSKTIDEIDLIAVTNRPGLVGSLIVGIETAKNFCYFLKKPLIAINHLQAHFYALQLATDISFPYIGLLVSGGHTLLAICRDIDKIEIVGNTLDDACGEAFDKIAAHFKIGFPGGPAVEKKALLGEKESIVYPKPMLNQKGKNKYNFSFSGLKTGVIYHTDKYAKKKNYNLADICYCFQSAICETLFQKTMLLVKETEIDTVGLVGGVSANEFLQNIFYHEKKIRTFVPPLSLCTDNGAMIAGLGLALHQKNNKEKAQKKNYKEWQKINPIPQNFKGRSEIK